LHAKAWLSLRETAGDNNSLLPELSCDDDDYKTPNAAPILRAPKRF
jgi:hypothetical protein